MGVEETLGQWRDDAQTRAIAHQGTATFDRTLHSVLAYGAPFFALLGGSTLITSIFASPPPGLGQRAAISSLIAAVMSGFLAVRDLEKSEEKHRKESAQYTRLKMNIQSRLDKAREGTRPTDAEMDAFSKRFEELDSKPSGAPAWIYGRAKRAVKKAATK